MTVFATTTNRLAPIKLVPVSTTPNNTVPPIVTSTEIDLYAHISQLPANGLWDWWYFYLTGCSSNFSLSAHQIFQSTLHSGSTRLRTRQSCLTIIPRRIWIRPSAWLVCFTTALHSLRDDPNDWVKFIRASSSVAVKLVIYTESQTRNRANGDGFQIMPGRHSVGINGTVVVFPLEVVVHCWLSWGTTPHQTWLSNSDQSGRIRQRSGNAPLTKGPQSNPKCDSGHGPLMSPNGSHTRLWCFPSVGVNRTACGVCVESEVRTTVSQTKKKEIRYWKNSSKQQPYSFLCYGSFCLTYSVIIREGLAVNTKVDWWITFSLCEINFICDT